jgi:CheY-like chemotaxis protein
MAKILVVDDEPDALEVLGFNLKNAGYEVTTA